MDDQEVDQIIDEPLRVKSNERLEYYRGSSNNFSGVIGDISPHKTTDTSAGVRNTGINLYSATSLLKKSADILKEDVKNQSLNAISSVKLSKQNSPV